MNDANTAYAEAEKAFEEENKEMRECINNVGNDMSDADRELLGKARLSLVELTHAKYGGTPEGEKKFREIEFELCPASAKIPRFLETRNRAYSKITDLHEKIMEIKENSTLYSPGVTEGDSTSTETTPEG